MCIGDKLNLKALKRSGDKKHEKIYNKATMSVENGYKTKEFSEEYIVSLSQLFPTLKIKLIGNDFISIQSRVDEWIVRNDRSFLSLYHKKLVLETTRRYKEKYHIQDVFHDLEYLLASIVTHDNFVINNIKSDYLDVFEYI